MRVVFCGSGVFAVPSLRALAAAGHQIAAVITQPARPAGRGGKLTQTAVARTAPALGLEPIGLADINTEESFGKIHSLRPDVICVVDFGQLIGRPVRDEAAVSTFNLHGSLLPELRGAAPVSWAIIRGYKQTGVSTFELVDKMDAGPIYVQVPTEIGPQETAQELRARLADIGAEAVGRTLEMLAAGACCPTPQDEAKVTLAPKLKKTDGRIDWTADAATICNLVRGARPWPSAQALFVRSDQREVPVSIAAASVAPGPDGPSGSIDKELLVAAGKGRVRIEQIIPAGGRLMSWRDFVNGYRVGPCDRFVSCGGGQSPR